MRARRVAWTQFANALAKKTLPHVNVEVVKRQLGPVVRSDPILPEFDRVRCRVITGREHRLVPDEGERQAGIIAQPKARVGRIDSGDPQQDGSDLNRRWQRDERWFEVLNCAGSLGARSDGGASR
jgi:hypothetical protein